MAGLEMGPYGSGKEFALAHYDCIKLLLPVEKEVFLLVHNGKLVIQCETDCDISKISGPGMISAVMPMSLPTPSVKEIFKWEDLLGKGEYELCVVVPACKGLNRVYLSFSDAHGGLVILGDPSILEVCGPGLCDKVEP